VFIYLTTYISLGLLIYSDLNLVALTSQPLPFHSTAHVLCLDSPHLTGGSVVDKSTCLECCVSLFSLFIYM